MNVETHTSNINDAIQAFYSPAPLCDQVEQYRKPYGLVLKEFDPEKDKFLFLDIDGVLHPFGTMEAFFENEKFVIRRNETSYVGRDNEPFCFWPNLEKLVKYFDLKIILHSAWRLAYSLTELQEHLPPTLMEKIVGITNPNQVYRYPSIAEFIQGSGIKKFAIIDDDLKDFPDKVVKSDYFVGTSSRLGLTHVQLAKLATVYLPPLTKT